MTKNIKIKNKRDYKFGFCSWSYTLRIEQGLRVFENEVLGMSNARIEEVKKRL
jgi:hypothetical protein